MARKTTRRKKRTTALVSLQQGAAEPVVARRIREDNGKVSKNARSLRLVDGRHGSTPAYVQYAAAAGGDVLRGEPAKPFLAVNAIDNTTLRIRALDQRIEEWRRYISGGGDQKQVTG